MASLPKIATPINLDDLHQLAATGKKYEVWEGELREKMATLEHGEISNLIAFLLNTYIIPRRLGNVYPADTTYVVAGTRHQLDAALMPDVSFIQAARLEGVEKRDFAYLPPDLAIEVIAKSERRSEVMAKIAAYLAFGTAEVWSVYPDTQTIMVFRDEGTPQTYQVGDTIIMQGALAGLTIEVAPIFGG